MTVATRDQQPGVRAALAGWRAVAGERAAGREFERWAKVEVPARFRELFTTNSEGKQATAQELRGRRVPSILLPKTHGPGEDRKVPAGHVDHGLVVRYELTLPPPFTVAQVRKQSAELAEALNVHAVRIVEGRAATRHQRGVAAKPETIRHDMFVVVTDPLPPEETVRFPSRPILDVRPGKSAVGMAQTELNKPMMWPLAGSHGVVAGGTGSGKTFTVSALVAGLALWQPGGLEQALGPVEGTVRQISVSIGDAKETFAGVWAPRCTITAAGAGADADPDVADLVAMARIEAMLCAHRDLARRRQTTKKASHGIAEVRDPSDAMPIAWAILDEVASYMRSDVDAPGGDVEWKKRYEKPGRVKARRKEVLLDLAEKAREAGVVLLLATQFPYADVIDTKIRGNMGIRVCHRVTEREQPKVILGDSINDEIPFKTFTDAADGEFVYRRNRKAGPGAELERGGPFRARGMFMEQGQMRALAAASAHLAPGRGDGDIGFLLDRYDHWCHILGAV